MKKLALLLIVVSLLVASPVMANSGNDLLGYCGDVIKLINNKDDLYINPFNTGYCYGLLMGTLGSDEVVSKYNNTQKICCIPSEKEVTLDQLVTVVVKYMNKHPEKLNYSASATILIALRETFPCTKTKPSK